MALKCNQQKKRKLKENCTTILCQSVMRSHKSLWPMNMDTQNEKKCIKPLIKSILCFRFMCDYAYFIYIFMLYVCVSKPIKKYYD